MKEMEKEYGDKEFKSTESVEFPLHYVKFKGQLWTLQKTRRQLSSYLKILGFGNTGTKKFTDRNDEHDGWLQEHNFKILVILPM